MDRVDRVDNVLSRVDRVDRGNIEIVVSTEPTTTQLHNSDVTDCSKYREYVPSTLTVPDVYSRSRD